MQHREEAEDLTQDCLLKAWSKREELADVDNLKAYCLTMCRNLALDRLSAHERSNISLEQSLTDTCTDEPEPDEQLERQQRLDYVRHLIDNLPEKQSTAIQLRDIEGLTYQEAAHIMQLSEDNFKVTLHRARKTLKAAFEKSDRHGL